MNLTAQEIAAAMNVLDEILTDAGLGAEEDVTKGAHPGLMIYKTGNTPNNVGVRVRLALGAAIVRRMKRVRVLAAFSAVPIVREG